MLWGQFMELRGEVLWRLLSPHGSQVFVESMEVSGRSGMVIGQLDKITCESAPTDKASTSNTMFFLEATVQEAARDFSILGGIQPQTACQDLFRFLFFLLFPPNCFSSNPSHVFQTLRPPFYILSGSEGALGAKKKAAT